MSIKPDAKRGGLFKGIAAAYAILFLHVLLIAALGLIVIFLTGIAHYLFWILSGGMALIGLSAYFFWRKLRREGKSLRETLQSPAFQGREVEVSLLGGMAAMRLGPPAELKPLPPVGDEHAPMLEDPQTRHVREIQALADLLEKKLISQEEFDQAKHLIFRSAENGR
jgi:hypothetical protein